MSKQQQKAFFTSSCSHVLFLHWGDSGISFHQTLLRNLTAIVSAVALLVSPRC